MILNTQQDKFGVDRQFFSCDICESIYSVSPVPDFEDLSYYDSIGCTQEGCETYDVHKDANLLVDYKKYDALKKKVISMKILKIRENLNETTSS